MDSQWWVGRRVLDICRGFLLGACPQSLRFQPSWPQTLAVPRHRPTSRPLCPDNSRRDAGIISAHCHRLIESGSEQNRSRQIAPLPKKSSSISFRSRRYDNILLYLKIFDFHSKLLWIPSRVLFIRRNCSLEFFFLFFPRRHGTRNYEGSDSFRSRGHATPALDGAAWRGPVS